MSSYLKHFQTTKRIFSGSSFLLQIIHTNYCRLINPFYLVAALRIFLEPISSYLKHLLTTKGISNGKSVLLQIVHSTNCNYCRLLNPFISLLDTFTKFLEPIPSSGRKKVYISNLFTMKLKKAISTTYISSSQN